MCKDCGNCFNQYATTQTRCDLCAFNRYTKPRKPLKRIGKITKRWLEFRKQWLEQNPPEGEYYTCGICYRPINKDWVTLDHIVARSKRPDLRFDPANIQVACYICNYEKGSKNA